MYSGAEANGEKTQGLSARALATEVPLQQLVTSYEQALSIAALYRAGKIQDKLYSPGSAAGRWSMQWKDQTGKRKGGLSERVLYQWFVHTRLHQHIIALLSFLNGFPYTGCLGHAEVTYELPSSKVLRIRGFLDHNEACRLATMENKPTHPVHPAVYKVALDQLRDGSTWSDIMEKNRKYVLDCLYPGQKADWAYSNYRWLLKRTDSRSRNIDSWLNPSSPDYNSTLAEAVFFYSARAATEERLKICIATPEMKEAAWRYGHNQQILLDGTFGVFLMFSAPSGNKFTPAGYDTAILTELLSKWKSSLGVRKGTAFHSPVAITDTDLKERNALLEVFPNIWLLLSYGRWRGSHSAFTAGRRADTYKGTRGRSPTCCR
ncbi:uncharacterized protein STEHIDRAFT_119664 [Stereum hirsutum FP-91666 SS1]|uniref:uncharacterized protein n=1 Tax=Stereum hirsutum (strain FP-91666) TaxID=721885 RepID=UPI0004409FCD|nr:uncharacterized protein STEHIDRAFT_119664 [Stereum hirsutum FP-91666 SS1]EIM88874.1 hypothetical protein STEHIDRAFT_119664 [Stereum hirsutum FP-91666 SS1]